MRKKIILSAILIATSFTVFAQVGIDTTSPEGALDVVSTDSGVLLPRVANSAAVTTPVNAMLIYDLLNNCMRAYQNSDWSTCLGDPVPSVISPSGKIWMDRNLGATQVATSTTDADSYGDLYQWGRNTDGHEKRNSTVVAGPVSSGSEGSDFITNGTTLRDWLSTQDDTRWNGATKGTHDPCPNGYRVPTEAEFNAERLLFPTNTGAGAYASVLKLTLTGRRDYNTSNLDHVGNFAYYWTSTVNDVKAVRLTSANGNNFKMDYGVRGTAFSVRCLRE